MAQFRLEMNLWNSTSISQVVIRKTTILAFTRQEILKKKKALVEKLIDQWRMCTHLLIYQLVSGHSLET